MGPIFEYIWERKFWNLRFKPPNCQKTFLIVSNWLGMLNNIYLSTLYKNILPNPDFGAHFGTKISVPKFSFRNALFIQLSPQIHHKIILNSYLMRLSIVLWFVMVSEQFEQIFQNMLLLGGNFRAIPLSARIRRRRTCWTTPRSRHTCWRE